ncbi:hypothetical protein GK047_28985 [Paenibacillus sp. SYP-B3998]|uniref:Uncharacterized protein n=1 Tax=Paenibacillus sp. SYP-B3998 TaxID=2678564 RepID=A0A6G4A6C2_9BACL|nr:hypothetical protein [Paenibacillus sp. SYP-B3998]NEW09922.1 hypothetical protein [Paenibacillus sp. SYP-B3998]
MRTWKGTRYSNEKHQRQAAGYSRVYDKKRQLMKRYGKVTQGELTRFDIVYVPDEKIPLEAMVQFPPKFNRLYLCTHLTHPEHLKPKQLERGYGLMSGELRTATKGCVGLLPKVDCEGNGKAAYIEL